MEWLLRQNVLFVAIQLAEPDPDYDPIDIGDDDGSGNVSGAPDFTGLIIFLASFLKFIMTMMLILLIIVMAIQAILLIILRLKLDMLFLKLSRRDVSSWTPDSEKTIYVWAAGNAGGYADQGVDYSSPELLPGMAHYIPEIQGHSIAVVSVDENGEISDFSSRCGVAQDYCIAAPGGRITAAYPTSTSDTGIILIAMMKTTIAVLQIIPVMLLPMEHHLQLHLFLEDLLLLLIILRVSLEVKKLFLGLFSTANKKRFMRIKPSMVKDYGSQCCYSDQLDK